MLFSISSAPPLSTRVCASLAHLLDLACVTRLELNTGALFDIPLGVLAALLTGLRSVHDAVRRVQRACRPAVDPAGACGKMGVAAVRGPRHACASRACAHWRSANRRTCGTHFSDSWLEPAIACAQARHLHGAPIETLEFYRCNGDLAGVDRAPEEFVGQVAIYPEGRHQTQF